MLQMLAGVHKQVSCGHSRTGLTPAILAVPQWGAKACDTPAAASQHTPRPLDQGQMLTSPPWSVCRTCQGKIGIAPRRPFGGKQLSSHCRWQPRSFQRGVVVSIHLPPWHPAPMALSVPPLLQPWSYSAVTMSDRNMQSVLANLPTDPAVISPGTDVSSHKNKQIFGLLMCLELPAYPAPG